MRVEGVYLEVMSWAREHDCLWNGLNVRIPALNGHLEVLKWARAHGCP
jgi:hypothetical protein